MKKSVVFFDILYNCLSFLFQNSFAINFCMILVLLSSILGYCKEVAQIFQQVHDMFYIFTVANILICKI